MNRIERGLPVDRPSCPYTAERLSERKFTLDSMLTNPFEKLERKRFMYYSRDLGQLSMNHALLAALDEDDYTRIRQQLRDDLDAYYAVL